MKERETLKLLFCPNRLWLSGLRLCVSTCVCCPRPMQASVSSSIAGTNMLSPAFQLLPQLGVLMSPGAGFSVVSSLSVLTSRKLVNGGTQPSKSSGHGEQVLSPPHPPWQVMLLGRRLWGSPRSQQAFIFLSQVLGIGSLFLLLLFFSF